MFNFIKKKYLELKYKFDSVDDFKDGFAVVKKDGKWGFINTKGEQAVECKFDQAWDFKNGLARVWKDGKEFTINTKGNFIVYDEDNNMIEVLNKVSDISENTFLLSKHNGKFGILDTDYNIVIKHNLYGEFDVIQRMNESIFLIKMAGKELLVDSNGDFK